MADGPSFVTETIYPARFRHVDELKNMGANIEADMETELLLNHHHLMVLKYMQVICVCACLIIAGL